MIVFISGPYTGEVDKNVALARMYSIKLWRCGIPNICPHLNTRDMEEYAPYDVFVEGYLKIQDRCHITLMVGDWKSSAGATREHLNAIALEMPIFYGEEQIQSLIDFYFSHTAREPYRIIRGGTST